MSWLLKFINFRNISLLAVGAFVIWFVIIYKANEAKKNKIIQLEFDLNNVIEANKTNQTALKLVRSNLQQCVYMRELNETSALEELQTNQRRIAEMGKNYDELREKYQTPKLGTCIEPVIGDDVVILLKQARGNQNRND